MQVWVQSSIWLALCRVLDNVIDTMQTWINNATSNPLHKICMHATCRFICRHGTRAVARPGESASQQCGPTRTRVWSQHDGHGPWWSIKVFAPWSDRSAIGSSYLFDKKGSHQIKVKKLSIMLTFTCHMIQTPSNLVHAACVALLHTVFSAHVPRMRTSQVWSQILCDVITIDHRI